MGSESSKKIGTTVPCGHCFHAECFEMWKAAKRGACKCPNCNVTSKIFLTLFLTVGAENASNEDDDLSLSSTDEDDNNEDHLEGGEGDNEDMQQLNDHEGQAVIGEQAESRASQRQSQDTMTIDDDNEDGNNDTTSASIARNAQSHASTNNAESDDDSVQVVDLTMSPERSPPVRQVTNSSTSALARRPPPSASSLNNDDGGNKTDRFKNIAKKYKQKFQQKQSQCQEQYKQHQELTKKMTEIQHAAAEKEDQLRQLEEQTQMQQLEIGSLSLTTVQRSNQLKDKNRQVAKLLSEIQRLTSEYQQLKASYDKDISQAHSSSTAEVKELAARTKAVEQENAQLRATIVNHHPQQQQFWKGTSSGGRNTLDAALGKYTKKTKRQDNNDVARALRGMDAVRTIPGSKRKSDHEETTTHDTSRYSAHASRFAMAAAAGQKKRKGPLGLAAAEMLSSGTSSISSSRKLQESTPLTTSLTINRNRRPLQRMNSNDCAQTKTKKAPSKVASIFQRP